MKGITFIIKPVGAACNLVCDYCYYREEASGDSVAVMDKAILSKFISEYLALPQRKAAFIWHGGESLLAGRGFFNEVIRLQEQYKQDGQQIANGIQTNATLVDRDWVEFFENNQFQVGVSLDGPLTIHNCHRCYPSGDGSFAKVMNAVTLLKESGVRSGALVVLTKESLGHEEEIFQFLVESGIYHFELRPCSLINRLSGDIPDCSLSPKEFAESMIRIFDLWWERDDPKIRIRLFEDVLRGMLGGKPDLCDFAGTCTAYFTLDLDGSVYPCDKFAGLSTFKLGNILESSLTEILASESCQNFAAQVEIGCSKCSECEWFSICNGGCTYYRYMRKGDLTDRDYFCSFRQLFFQHVKEKVGKLQEEKEVRRECLPQPLFRATMILKSQGPRS